MTPQSLHKESDSHSRLDRVIKNIWIHSRAEQWTDSSNQQNEEKGENGVLYLLTRRQPINCNEIESPDIKERDEFLKQIRIRHQVSEALPVSVFTKHTAEYCEETKRTYSNEYTYYNSPPGKSFKGSI